MAWITQDSTGNVRTEHLSAIQKFLPFREGANADVWDGKELPLATGPHTIGSPASSNPRYTAGHPKINPNAYASGMHLKPFLASFHSFSLPDQDPRVTTPPPFYCLSSRAISPFPLKDPASLSHVRHSPVHV